ncbi:MAG: immunity 63 family protein [Anaerolineaceae bacterium]|nr:immunity 63 family protein [Anaerolineaceae bacterium]
MNFLSLGAIRRRINKMAKVISAPKPLLPTMGSSRDAGYPHVEVDENGYHYVIVERGKEFSRKTYKDIDKLLYIVFDHITQSMASDYELNNRIDSQDSRRLIFDYQLRLLSQIDEAWSTMKNEEIGELLIRHPYVDK